MIDAVNKFINENKREISVKIRKIRGKKPMSEVHNSDPKLCLTDVIYRNKHYYNSFTGT